MIRHDWTLEELQSLYDLPLLGLVSKANAIHRAYHNVDEIQVCNLISIKTGGCSEDCKYCAQSSHYQTSVNAQPMMSYDDVIESAKKAIARGVTRICLGAAWREVRDNKQFEDALKIIKGVAELGVEVCVTFGMLNEQQAKKLKDAGLYAYNHNLDTSEKYYKTIITTRTYQDRLNTLDVVEKTGLSVCCGGILGLGEQPQDRLEMLLTLSNRDPHPESFPINQIEPIPGTPLENQPKVPFWDFLRYVAVARIALPNAMIRLSAGRINLSYEEQTLCFICGANSIFLGEKLLTVANSSVDKDEKMFDLLKMTKRPAFKRG